MLCTAKHGQTPNFLLTHVILVGVTSMWLFHACTAKQLAPRTCLPRTCRYVGPAPLHTQSDYRSTGSEDTGRRFTRRRDYQLRIGSS